jgi:hypothetical protein
MATPHQWDGRNPGENASKAKTVVTKSRLWVDSRDRNITTYPCANSFRVSLATPLRAIKSITLTDFRVPIISGYYYAVLALRNVKDNTLLQIKEDGGWPMGTLGIIPLVPAEGAGGTYAYYHNTVDLANPGGWRIDFPQAMGQLSDLQFEVVTWGGGNGWGGPTVVSTLYPIPTEAGAQTSDIDKNVLIGLEVEHNCQ